MVLSAERKNQMIIKELEHFNGLLSEHQGNIEQAINAVKARFPSYAKTLATAAAEIRAAVAMNAKIIAVLGGEDRELERERRQLLADARRYGAEIIARIAEE